MKAKIILLLFLISCKQESQSQTETLNISQEYIESVVQGEVAKFLKSPYTALSGVIYINGESYQFHFGKLSNGKRANNETLHEIGSITKTYTGLILSQAVAEGKVSLDTDVRTYLDGQFPNFVLANNTPITLRHLITHTSGLPPVINCGKREPTDEQVSCFENFTKADFFEALQSVKLTDTSGKNYNYSNAGVQLVGYILEGIYQSSFQELFSNYIFKRSGEQNTLSELKYDDASNISLGQNDKKVSMPLINGFYKYAGGLKSSTSSMSNYLKMYLEGDDKVIKQATSQLAGNMQYGRAYAWNTYDYDKKKKMLYHNGGTLGHSSWIALYPNQKVGIFLVTNILTDNSQGDLNDLSNMIINRLF